MAQGLSNINSSSCQGMYGEAVLEKMKRRKHKKQKEFTAIKTLHEKWAVKNGYRNNDRLNSQNTIGFKNGAER